MSEDREKSMMVKGRGVGAEHSKEASAAKRYEASIVNVRRRVPAQSKKIRPMVVKAMKMAAKRPQMMPNIFLG